MEQILITRLLIQVSQHVFTTTGEDIKRRLQKLSKQICLLRSAAPTGLKESRLACHCFLLHPMLLHRAAASRLTQEVRLHCCWYC
ncbi:TPA: hypothetical protein ACH3X2_009088 [Trebouxia sp. C0005]